MRPALLAVAGGGVIAYPTEAVFGIGCDPASRRAVARVVALKQREASKGLIIVGATLGQIEPFVQFPDQAVRERVLATWPGPNTWVLPARSGLDPLLTGGRATIAVRVTAHPPTVALCLAAGPLVSTSANRSGRPAIRESLRCRVVLGRLIDAIAPGEVGRLAAPTTIRDSLTGAVLRPGPAAGASAPDAR
jgi:L-threonylcarbamoyladenylate synthase